MYQNDKIFKEFDFRTVNRLSLGKGFIKKYCKLKRCSYCKFLEDCQTNRNLYYEHGLLIIRSYNEYNRIR